METLYTSGARVLIDGEDEAIVRASFPKGSTSFAFPHYKVDIMDGDRNVAIALSRVGVSRKGSPLARRIVAGVRSPAPP